MKRSRIRKSPAELQKELDELLQQELCEIGISTGTLNYLESIGIHTVAGFLDRCCSAMEIPFLGKTLRSEIVARVRLLRWLPESLPQQSEAEQPAGIDRRVAE